MKTTRFTTPTRDEIVRPTGPTYEEIAQRAHEIWEKSGQPEGHDVAQWLQAERELREEQGRSEWPDTEPGALHTHSGFVPETKNKPTKTRS